MTLILNIADRRFAFGLKWDTLPTGGASDLLDFAKERALQMKTPFGVVHHDTRSWLGTSEGAAKVDSKTFSAALAVARAPEIRVVVAALGADRYWIAAGGHEHFDPRGDVIGDLRTVSAIVDDILSASMRSSGVTPIVVCTPDVNLDSAFVTAVQRQGLEQALAIPMPPPEALFRRFNARSFASRIPMIAACSFLAYALFQYGFSRYQERSNQLKALENAQQLSLENASKEKLQAAAKSRALTDALAVDTKFEHAQSFYSKCVDRANNIGRFAAGWAVTKITCDGLSSSLNVSAALHYPSPPSMGNYSSIATFAHENLLTASFDPNLSSVNLSATIEGQSQHGASSVDVLPASDLVEAVLGDTIARAKRADPLVTLSLNAASIKQIEFADPTLINADGTTGKSTVPASESYLIYEGSLQVPAVWRVPDNMLSFTDYLRISSIELTPSDAGWRAAITFRIFSRSKA